MYVLISLLSYFDGEIFRVYVLLMGAKRLSGAGCKVEEVWERNGRNFKISKFELLERLLERT